jgi:monoamine oxidase
MTRKEFLKACGMLGIGLPLMNTISSCDAPLNPGDKVLIIGAGAAGMSAGYLLNKQGVDFEILEASDTYGGRMKTNTSFADFPIPLGAEWLHVGTDVFTDLIPDGSANVTTVPYDQANDYGLWDGEQITIAAAGFDGDRKFVGGTWLTFFQDNVVPSILDKISFNQVVQSIDYSGDEVIVQTTNGQHTANRVIFTAPVKILQVGDITFTPALPSRKQNAINDVQIWDGFKAFIEFSDNVL